MKRNIYKRTRRHRRQPNTISNDVQQLIETLIYAAQNGLSLADVGITVIDKPNKPIHQPRISHDDSKLIESLIYAVRTKTSLADVGIIVQNQLSDCMHANNKEK